MVTVRYDELLFGFEFVSSSPELDVGAYVSLETGEVFCDTGDFGDEELPVGLDDPTRYLPVPEKGDLDLGSHLVFRFVEEELPDRYDEVREIFRHKGAYRRFKDLIESDGVLEKWFAYEAAAVQAALTEWASENGLAVELTGNGAPV